MLNGFTSYGNGRQLSSEEVNISLDRVYPVKIQKCSPGSNHKEHKLWCFLAIFIETFYPNAIQLR